MRALRRTDSHEAGAREAFLRAFPISVDPSACWKWPRSRSPLGYGRMTITRGRRGAAGRYKGFFAHRVAYESFVGPIPEGLVLDHLCRNPPCCNPAHLEPVTQRVNVLRGESPAAHQARQTHCKHGHEFTPENTRWFRDKKRECRACDLAGYHRRKANQQHDPGREY